MAGMFYTLQEAAEKLNKTEEEIEQIIEQGKLRGFRDGPSVYLKIDEVEAFASEESISPAPEAPQAPQAEEPATVPTELEPSPVEEQELPLPELEQEDIGSIEFDETEIPAEEPEMEAVEALAEVKPAIEPAIKEIHAARPKKEAKKSRPKVQPRIKQTGKPHRMSFGQWLLFSLSDDNPAAVFILILLCCVILSTFAAFVYGLHYLYINF